MIFLQHISLATADLARSIAFYRDVFEFKQVPRPAFSTNGAWLEFGACQIHLIDNPNGTFRRSTTIDSADTHYAIRVDDFEATVAMLTAKGFREDALDGDVKRLLTVRGGVAKFPQAYVLDPDLHIIEINAKA
jgi:catechol 2,3-dioxygenase-like lactoylglutathione lyase family enzyme